MKQTMNVRIAGLVAWVTLALVLQPLRAVSFSVQCAPSPRPVPEFEAFVQKAQRGETIKVAYLGGSITRGASVWPRSGTNVSGAAFDYSSFNQEAESWRALTFEWLRARFEKTPGQFTQVNAAIGGTPSLLGTYRLEQDILSQAPDLVFVEFAVNDNGAATLTRDTPEAPKSILRTCKSIVSRLREQNPQVAVFMPLSTHRMLDGSANTAWGGVLDLGLEQTLLAAEALQVPYANIREAFYGDSGSQPVAPYYDGPDDPGCYVHPAPYGHQAYAEAVEKTLADIFQSGTFLFTNSGASQVIQPYPVAPLLVLPETLATQATGWHLETPANVESPCLEGHPCLVSGSTNDVLEYTFNGTAAGLWCDIQSKGGMEVWLDGTKLGRHINGSTTGGQFNGRFVVLSTALAPAVPHTLRLVPVSLPDVAVPRIMLRGVTVDAGTP
jgi:lysophospholipase L1-like esterase